jgi:type IV secretion system protein VirB5
MNPLGQPEESSVKHRRLGSVLLIPVLLYVTGTARAQFAVIDVASVAQLVAQLQTLEQQLAQAQAQYQALTGARGMEQLLAGTNRNYLPADWAALAALPGNAGAYPDLAGQVGSALSAETVLSPGRLALLPTATAAQLQAQRQNAALLQGMSRAALANSSTRFAALQQLIDALGRAADEKASLDLTARVAAENAMLQNEHTKVQVLYQGLQADQWAAAQHARELAIAGHGQFDGRFQPHP